jgi:ABC-type multidrug transport system fused ATPase/permease subunit
MSPSRRLLAYVARYKGKFIGGFLCIIATSAITLAGPWVLKLAIDDLTKTGVTVAKLRFYGSAILALALVGGVLDHADDVDQRLVMRDLEGPLEIRLREMLWRFRESVAKFLQRLGTPRLRAREKDRYGVNVLRVCANERLEGR